MRARNLDRKKKKKKFYLALFAKLIFASCIYINIYIYIHPHIYIHTYVYIYIHVYLALFVKVIFAYLKIKCRQCTKVFKKSENL